MMLFKQFLARPYETGTIAPSSQALSTFITDLAELHNKKCVVEFGPGTGVFTEEVLRKKRPDCLFFSLEVNPRFAQATKRRCPDVLVYEASATDIAHYLSSHGKEECDCIISGLPWRGFDQDLQEEILENAHGALSSDGVFLTFAYAHGLALPSGRRFRRRLTRRFRNVHTTEIVWKNLPPALVYYCTKRKGTPRHV